MPDDKNFGMSPLTKQPGDIPNLQENRFHGRMIEDSGCQRSAKLSRREWVLDKALRSLFFGNLEEIGMAYEIKEFK